MIKNSFPMPPKYWLWQAFIYALFFFAIFFLPPFGSKQIEWASNYIQFMKYLVPMLASLGQLTDENFYISFYYSTIWTIAPILGFASVFFATFVPEVKETRNLRLSGSLLGFFKGILIFAFGFGVLLVWPVDASRISWRDRGLVGSEVGIFFFGLMIVWVTTLLAVYIYHASERLKYLFASKA